MTPATVAANPWELKARMAKAIAIADVIWSRLTVAERRSWSVVDAVANRSELERLGFAAVAGQRPPSPETWDLVVGRIRFLHEEELAKPLVVPSHRVIYLSVRHPGVEVDISEVFDCPSCEAWGHSHRCEHCRGTGLLHGYDASGWGLPVRVKHRTTWREAEAGPDPSSGQAPTGPQSPLPPLPPAA